MEQRSTGVVVGLVTLVVALSVALAVVALASGEPRPLVTQPAPATTQPAQDTTADTAPPDTATPETATPAGGDADAIEMVMTEFAFAPADLQAPAGQPIVIDLVNEGAVEHNLTIDDAGASADLAAGESGSVSFEGLAAGSYRFYCSIPGHAEAGMEGTLEVGEGGEPVGAAGQAMTPEEMDASYMAGVAAFPAETSALGGQPLEPVLDGDVKVFELTASVFEWETEPGVFREAWGYNGQVPGPEIRVQLGDQVRIVFINQLEESSAVHFHGLEVPNDQDGVPGLTQPLVLPGETFTYEFTVPNSGSHMYHSHMNGANQIPRGLLGAFIVGDPADQAVDQDVTMILNDGPLGYTLNGKGFPATQPIVATVGETVRIRYMNEGLQIHPMHLHGMRQLVVAKDGFPLPQPHFEDTVLVAPGERIDVLVEVDSPGLWAYHCHILSHAEDEEGMFGMVTVFVAQEA